MFYSLLLLLFYSYILYGTWTSVKIFGRLGSDYRFKLRHLYISAWFILLWPFVDE